MMKTLIPRVVCPLCVLVGYVSIGNPALAQGAANDASRGGSAPRSAGRGAGVKDVLDHPRLRPKVSVERDQATVEQALEKLGGFTPIHLTAEGAALRKTTILFHYTAVPLRDVLASIAATGEWEWTWKDEQTLVLKERPHPHLFSISSPNVASEKEVYEHGAEFLGQAGQLSPALQNALGAEDSPQGNGKQPGISFDTLPAGMQDTLRAMLEAHHNDQIAKGANPTFTAEDLSRSKVILQPVAQHANFNAFEVVVSTDPSGGNPSGTGMAFRVLPDIPSTPGSLAPSVASRKAAQDLLSRQQALANDPHLKETVSLDMRNATLFQALKALSAKTEFAFLGQYLPDQGKAVQKNISLPAMPLGEMLDRLTALYSGYYNDKRYRYTWGQQGDQIYVLHLSEATNP